MADVIGSEGAAARQLLPLFPRLSALHLCDTFTGRCWIIVFGPWQLSRESQWTYIQPQEKRMRGSFGTWSVPQQFRQLKFLELQEKEIPMEWATYLISYRNHLLLTPSSITVIYLNALPSPCSLQAIYQKEECHPGTVYLLIESVGNHKQTASHWLTSSAVTTDVDAGTVQFSCKNSMYFTY